MDARPRPLVARADGRRLGRLPRRAARQRASRCIILYTSGSTGKPKGILHTTGGYLLGVTMTTRWVFDLKDDDTYWCTADVGWVTGHSYLVYGPLANGATCVMYEGAPNWPDEDRFWKIIEKYRVTILYTAPTAIRAFIKWGEQFPRAARPVEPPAAGHGRRADQSRGLDVVSQGHRRRPMPDRRHLVADRDRGDHDLAAAGRHRRPSRARRPARCRASSRTSSPRTASRCGANQGGFLVIRQPWPSMLRTIYGDDERYKAQYWSDIPGCYFTGDGARRDENGNYWIMGRVDDVLNVAGHRLSHDGDRERAGEPSAGGRGGGRRQARRAEGARRSPRSSPSNRASSPSEALRQELRAHVAKEIGALARPDEIRFTDSLPKTRSGKIMRRLLRDIAAGVESTGDTTTLEDLSVLARLRQKDDEE